MHLARERRFLFRGRTRNNFVRTTLVATRDNQHWDTRPFEPKRPFKVTKVYHFRRYPGPLHIGIAELFGCLLHGYCLIRAKHGHRRKAHLHHSWQAG